MAIFSLISFFAFWYLNWRFCMNQDLNDGWKFNKQGFPNESGKWIWKQFQKLMNRRTVIRHLKVWVKNWYLLLRDAHQSRIHNSTNMQAVLKWLLNCVLNSVNDWLVLITTQKIKFSIIRISSVNVTKSAFSWKTSFFMKWISLG